MARTFLGANFIQPDDVSSNWQFRRADDTIRVMKMNLSENGTPVVDFKLSRMDALAFCENLRAIALSKGKDSEGE